MADIMRRKERNMKISVILGHPYEKSLNAAIAGVVTEALLEEGHEIRFHDLYQEKFNPVISGGGLPMGLLKARAALVFNTSNTPERREEEVFGDPLQRLWRDCIFAFCGVHTFDRKMFRVVADSSEEERGRWLEEVKVLVSRYFPEERRSGR